MSVPAVTLENVSVEYGAVRAVDDVSLTVEQESVHVLLGRSGSGKTTLLRAIAGFEAVSGGRILIAGVEVDGQTWVAPERRRIGFVFQDYALFSHLDAGGNVGFGAPGDRAARKAAAERWLGRVELGDHASRKPGELSGGEQQRVALVRALAQEPTLVLLDEPFSNLDPHLRRQVRDDTISLLRDSGMTAVFVTHDVEEAFAVGDHLSVMDGGRVAQTGTAQDLYDRPASRAVASLCGPTSFVRVDSVTSTGLAVCALGEVSVMGPVSPGSTLVIRPEHVVLADDGVVATVLRRRFLGSSDEIVLGVDGHELLARFAPGVVAADAGSLTVGVLATVAAVD